MEHLGISKSHGRFQAWTVSSLVAALVVVGLEWEHYRHPVRSVFFPTTMSERIVIAWLLWAKTLCLMTPALLAGLGAARLGWRRSAQALWLGGASATLLWLVIDLRLQSLTGNHLSNYWAFLLSPSNYEYAGDLWSLVLPVLGVLATIVIALAVLHAACAWLLRQAPWPAGRRGGIVGAACLFVALVGVIPAHAFLSNKFAVAHVHAALPCDPYRYALALAPRYSKDQFRRTVQRQLGAALAELQPALQTLAPPDDHVLPLRASKPHVVILVLESLRHDALTAGYMPKMNAWAQSGLRCERHYSSSNCSHLGIFALLFARSPMLYWRAVETGAVPQACASFHAAGYECNYLASNNIDYLRMSEFLKTPVFDRVEMCNHEHDWPTDDRIALRRAKQLLSNDKPQFVMVFLTSTHFPYRYPPNYERHRPVIAADQVIRATPSQKMELLNRYRNAAQFLDDELAEFIGTLDPKKHVIALTGDHGESHFDDGLLTHWGALSDAQSSPPLVVVGAGVPCRTIRTATTHTDLLPTLLHALTGQEVRLGHCSGRDLLAGPQPDQAFICTKCTGYSYWEGTMIRSQERLQLRFTLEPAWLQVMGFVDQHGRSDPSVVHLPKEAPDWTATIRSEWEKLAR